MDDIEEFAKTLTKDPSFLEKLKKRTELEEFKKKYNLQRATPLKCPACSQWGQTGGSLWITKDNPKRFVCRKCKLVWLLDCQTISNEELILQLRQVGKEDL